MFTVAVGLRRRVCCILRSHGMHVCLIQVVVSVNSVFKEQMRSAVDRQDPEEDKRQTEIRRKRIQSEP